jgi:hypothetical protein
MLFGEDRSSKNVEVLGRAEQAEGGDGKLFIQQKKQK